MGVAPDEPPLPVELGSEVRVGVAPAGHGLPGDAHRLGRLLQLYCPQRHTHTGQIIGRQNLIICQAKALARVGRGQRTEATHDNESRAVALSWRYLIHSRMMKGLYS